MSTVAEILKSKADATVQTVGPDQTVLEALTLMAAKNIGALVVHDGQRVVGIVTERDYARKVVLMNRSSLDTPVRDIMTSHVMYVRPDQTTEDCMAIMSGNRVRHLPVMKGSELVGLISIGDLVKDIISTQQFTIDQLEHYIAGTATTIL
jgi:CBS domain-containing protein